MSKTDTKKSSNPWDSKLPTIATQRGEISEPDLEEDHTNEHLWRGVQNPTQKLQKRFSILLND